MDERWILLYINCTVGLGVGFKVFIIDNIYRKYPKVKEKYDGMAKLWRSLPTKAELLQRQSMTEDQLVRTYVCVYDLTYDSCPPLDKCL